MTRHVRHLRRKTKLVMSGLVGAALSLFFFIGIVCGFKFQLNIPLTYDFDMMLGVAYFKALATGDWFPYLGAHISATGAPFGTELSDLPTADNLHFLLIKCFSIFVRDPFALFNLYYLVGFPLTTVTMIYTCYRLRFPYLVGIILGILFSFLPYHLIRYWHLFLSSYFLLPLMGLVVLWLWLKKPLLFAFGTDSKFHVDLRSANAKFALVISFLAGMAGVYYAFFYLVFLSCAGLSAGFYRRTRYHVFSALALICVVISSLGLSAVSNLVYLSTHGKSTYVAQRLNSETELYGLKLVNLVLPRSQHRSYTFRKLKAKYHSYYPVAEGYEESVGLVALFGFAVILVRLLMLRRKNTGLDKISFLWVNGVLLSMVGGFAIVFADLVTNKFRCYNRVSIFLALFALLAVGFFLKELRKRMQPAVWVPLLAVLFVVGVYDQVTRDYKTAQSKMAPQYYSDAHFFQKIQNTTSAGTQILQLPFMPFPESPPIHGMRDYSHFRGYAFTDGLRWSYGVMRGRHGSDQVEKVSQLPLNLKNVRAMGYQGVYIDREGFSDQAKSLESELTHELGIAPIVSENEKLSYFPLI